MELSANGKRITDIEDYCKTLPQTHKWRDLDIPANDYPIIKEMLYELYELFAEDQSASDITPEKAFKQLQKKYRRVVKPSHFTQVYLEEVELGTLKRNKRLESALITSRCRGISGVSVVTIFLSPYPAGQKFSCKWDCAYCPNEPGQPRSYLFGEPGVLRANQNGFDCVKQMLSRIHAYKVNGHPTDKFEVLILGGTIHSYPKEYLEEFMRDIFYAANVCGDTLPHRPPLSLEAEKATNTYSEHRVIGVTVETRPDCITAQELRAFRRWGVTRVQLGVQHTHDDVLRAVNRGCTHTHTLAALKMLRDSCFKVDIHIMPNLPGSTPEKDLDMMDTVLTELQPDQVKVYPCETTPFTKILADYKSGKYKPYSDKELEDVIIYWKSNVHPWIRNNRIVRDIPDNYIIAGVPSSSERCVYQKRMKELNRQCKCIRCREAGRFPDADPATGSLAIRSYEAQGGREYFISWENEDRTILFGFLRLRVLPENQQNTVFPELTDVALIRELHVYGRTLRVGTSADSESVQHHGIGRKLMKAAEEIAYGFGYRKIAVISGVGVRNYYMKLGYSLNNASNNGWGAKHECGGEFMIKTLQSPYYKYMDNVANIIAILCVIVAASLALIAGFH